MFKSNKRTIDFYNNKIQREIENILGKHSETVLHSPVPFELGYEVGGGADVYVYREHMDGEVYLTTDLTGKTQEKNSIGNYELMICHPNQQDWGPNLISKLAYYTLESSLNPGETMDIGANFVLEDSEIKALIFSKYFDFKLEGRKYGVLLIIGITSDELEWAKKNGGKNLVIKLKDAGVYPTTDLRRKSIFEEE